MNKADERLDANALDVAVGDASPDCDLAAGQEACDNDQTRALTQTLAACSELAQTLSALFFKTLTQEQIDTLAQQDLSAFADLNEDFDRGLNDIVRYLRRRNTGTRQQLACDFTSAFVGTKTYEGKSAVPYESVFTSEDGLLCQQAYHDIVALYAREGLKKDDGLHIPDDHLSYMLEFTGVLLTRAASAIEAGDDEGARHSLACIHSFVETHMLSWFDAFSQRAQLLLETRFYRGVLYLTRGFLAFTLDITSDALEELGEGALKAA